MNRRKQIQKVGYLLKTYPKLSETFILNEIVQLERFSVPLHLFSLKKPVLGEKFHPAVSEVRANVTYVPSIGLRCDPIDAAFIVLDHLQLCLRNPFRYISTLWFYLRVPQHKRFKEFVQAGLLTRALQSRKIQHLHADFANIPTAVAELVKRMSGITYSFTAHAKDIYLSSQPELARKIQAAEFVLTCTAYNRKYLQDLGAGPTPIISCLPWRRPRQVCRSRRSLGPRWASAHPQRRQVLRKERLPLSHPGLPRSERKRPSVPLFHRRLGPAPGRSAAHDHGTGLE